MATSTRKGPALAVVGSCSHCDHLRMLSRFPVSHVPTAPRQHCAHPEIKGRTPREIGGSQKATPDWCPEMSAARLALLVDLARTVCRKCGRTVEPERECYAIPTCFTCLPPPPPMAVHPGFAEWTKKQEEEATKEGSS